MKDSARMELGEMPGDWYEACGVVLSCYACLAGGYDLGMSGDAKSLTGTGMPVSARSGFCTSSKLLKITAALGEVARLRVAAAHTARLHRKPPPPEVCNGRLTHEPEEVRLSFVDRPSRRYAVLRRAVIFQKQEYC